MTNKELFKSTSPLRGQEWHPPSCPDATFLVNEPNAGQAIELSKIAAGAKNEAEVTGEFLEYVWTRLVVDPDTGRAFTQAEYRDLLRVKDLMEMGAPAKMTMDYIQRLMGVSADVMQKNSNPTA